MTTKDLQTDGSVGPPTRCEHAFRLNGDRAQCSLPEGHEGDHHFEFPPLPKIRG
jgi:hypothetical protein